MGGVGGACEKEGIERALAGVERLSPEVKSKVKRLYIGFANRSV
jgi:hypothetical protein